MELTREQVLAYRVAAQGLHREAAEVEELGVLDLGVQDAPSYPAALAFAARLPAGSALGSVGPGCALALAWTLRGAPHVHRRADLDLVGRALWPLSEADAAGRLNESGPALARQGIPALEQFSLAVAAMREVVHAPIAKGAASTAVTQRIPPVMWRDCRACKAHHVSDSAMRAAAPAAGLELEPETNPPVLLPRPRARRPSRPDPDAVRVLIRSYLTYLGPAGPGEVAGYLGARRADLAPLWPDDLAEARVDGRAAWLPADALDRAESAPEPDVVRLLGPFDPYLQARDRDLIVPDRAMHKALWPVIGRPGVVLVEGEVVGVWRPKSSARRLTLTVEAVTPLAPSAWARIEEEAARVAEVRGAEDVAVVRAF